MPMFSEVFFKAFPVLLVAGLVAMACDIRSRNGGKVTWVTLVVFIVSGLVVLACAMLLLFSMLADDMKMLGLVG